MKKVVKGFMFLSALALTYGVAASAATLVKNSKDGDVAKKKGCRCAVEQVAKKIVQRRVADQA